MRAGLDSHQQRLRLSDLRHFRRRREAFQRRRETAWASAQAAGRSTEFGERERRAQFEAPRAWVLCDGDSGPEGVFRGRRLAGSRFSSVSPRTR